MKLTEGLPRDNYVSQAMSSFGRGISVKTQMLRAFSAIANDGQNVGAEVY